MTKKVKYRVLMQHVWGKIPRELELYDDEEEAQEKADDISDSICHAWVEEEIVEE